jgi:hypothetical protein
MDQGSSASNEETPATETSEDAAVSVSNQQLTIPLFDSTTHSDRTRDQLVGEGLERATVPSRFSPVNSLGPSIRFQILNLCTCTCVTNDADFPVRQTSQANLVMMR